VSKQVMNRKASDNEYLHRDFHGAMSCAIEYLHMNYGEEAVREYLIRFTRVFYATLSENLRERGLIALREHFEKLYDIEGGEVEIVLADDELVVHVHKCPAVAHLHENNRPVAALFYETTRTVNEAICEGTVFKAEFMEYNHHTGGNMQKFTRRDA